MTERIEEKYLDVLQNIEFAIVACYNADPDLIDAYVDKVVGLLIKTYQAQQRGRSAPPLKLTEQQQELYDKVKSVCDWRLEPLDSELAKTPDEIILCLKRIRKSVKFWTRENGRQGYLDYIVHFIPHDGNSLPGADIIFLE